MLKGNVIYLKFKFSWESCILSVTLISLDSYLFMYHSPVIPHYLARVFDAFKI